MMFLFFFYEGQTTLEKFSAKVHLIDYMFIQSPAYVLYQPHNNFERHIR